MQTLRLRILFFLFVVCLNLMATSQEPDRIYYKNTLVCIGNFNGTKLDGSCYPLEAYVSKLKLPLTNSSGYSTACARGYIATWRLRNDSIFLVKIQNYDSVEIPLKSLFPNEKTENGIYAFWYEGLLSIETNEGVMSSDSELRKNKLLFAATFKNGIVKEKLYERK